MQIQITITYHLTSIRMVIIKKTEDKKHWEAVEKLDSSHTVGKNVKLCSHYGK